MTITLATRKQLERLCRSRKTRMSLFSKAMPTHWAPHQVLNPETGEPFTPDAAWNFAADLIAKGHEIEIITLDKPKGKTGFVIKASGAQNEIIYIKLQIGSGQVFGRSFHISIPLREQS